MTKADEFNSDLKTAISLCAESQLFIDRVQDGQSTDAFNQGHAEYLQQLATDQLREADRAVPDITVAPRFGYYVQQLHALNDLLHVLKTARPGQDTLPKIRADIETIRRALQELQNKP